MKRICVSFISLSCLFFSANAQINNELKGLRWGIHIGGYFASNKEAEFYNGSSNKPAKLVDVLFTEYYYDRISEYYQDDFTLVNQVPMMKYTPNFSIGGGLQYYASKHVAFFTTISAVKLTTQGIFQIELISPSYDNSMNNKRINGTITGVESRFNIDAGIHYVFQSAQKVLPFIDIAGSLSYLDIAKHSVSIADFETQFLYMTNSFEESIETKLGYGMQVSSGVQFPIQNKLYMYVGASLDMLQYKIVEQGFSFQKTIYCKFLL